MMALLVLLACKQPVDTDAIDTDTDPVDTDAQDTSAPERSWLSSPAEAEDLDTSEGVVRVRLVAAAHSFEHHGETIEGYAYDGQIPGPTIRARVGDTLVVELQNDLAEPTTIHWHGLDVPWAMDGVTWMQDPVEAGASFTYEFPLTRAGTFWYHPHFDSERQVDLGLYGVLVVEDPADPPADAELIAVFDAWGEQHEHDRAGAPAHEHGDALLHWTVNGLENAAYAAAAGSTVRVRLLNASNTGYLSLVSADSRWIGSDQGLLAAAATVDDVVVAPGDRVELEWLVGPDGFTLNNEPYSLNGGAAHGMEMPLVEVVPEGEGSAPAAPAWPFSGEAPSPDAAPDVVWVFQGDGASWFINGEQYPDVTVPEVALGADTVLEIRNLSSTEHPFHVHGMRFEVLAVDGVPPAVKTVEDTINVPIRAAVRLRVRPENAGDWMAHCHILPHAHEGMMTLLRVNP